MNLKPQSQHVKSDQNRVMRRAAAAYLADEDTTGRWPDEVNSGLESHGEGRLRLLYAVLRDVRGTVLAAYRLRHDDKLKRLRSWPPIAGDR